MKRLRLPHPPVDASDMLALLGVALIAWTVYLLAAVWTPAFLGVAALVAWILREVTNGTARPRS